MPHTVVYQRETGIVEIAAEGVITLAEMKEIFLEGAKQLAKHKGHLTLSDYRKASIKLSTVDLFNLPQIVSTAVKLEGIDVQRLKRAIVMAPKDRADARFSENVTTNAGQNSKFFENSEKARAWLLSDT